jgi:hypothetical protein
VADRPAIGRPIVEAKAEPTITASRTPPASRLQPATAVTAMMTIPVPKSIHRSA